MAHTSQSQGLSPDHIGMIFLGIGSVIACSLLMKFESDPYLWLYLAIASPALLLLVVWFLGYAVRKEAIAYERFAEQMDMSYRQLATRDSPNGEHFELLEHFTPPPSSGLKRRMNPCNYVRSKHVLKKRLGKLKIVFCDLTYGRETNAKGGWRSSQTVVFAKHPENSLADFEVRPKGGMLQAKGEVIFNAKYHQLAQNYRLHSDKAADDLFGQLDLIDYLAEFIDSFPSSNELQICCKNGWLIFFVSNQLHSPQTDFIWGKRGDDKAAKAFIDNAIGLFQRLTDTKECQSG